jgi:hypothetical protein
LVEWVQEYLKITYGTARAEEIIEDIDHRQVPNSAFKIGKKITHVLGYQLFHRSLTYAAFPMAETSTNGLVMTRRL